MVFTDQAREAMSRAHIKNKSRSVPGVRSFMEHLYRSGYPSMRALGADLGVSAQFLSYVLRGNAPMPPHLAGKIEAATGYRANNWG